MDASSPSNVIRMLVGGAGGGEVSESKRMQADWERQIESLDQKEMELHQTQLRLIREQTATFIRDLGALRGEVGALKAAMGLSSGKVAESHASFNDRLQVLERFVGDSACMHEATAKDIKFLKDGHTGHLKSLEDLQAASSRHASMPERMEYIEKLLGDSADKHAEEVQSLRDAHSKHAQDLLDHHATVEERIQYVEKLLGDSADKHAKELKALKAAHDRHAGDLSEVKAGLGQHASLPERIDYLEQLLGDSADKHARELQDLKDAHAKFLAAHGKHAKDLEGLKALHAHHATMGERIEYLEKMLGDSADKHFEELQALKSAQTKHADALAKHGRDAGAALAQHASVAERIAYLEQLLGDSADKHTAELEALKTAHEMHGKELALWKDAQSKLSIESKAQSAKHLTTAERLDLLESRLKHCFSA
mmetsp:Transcript_10058/g.27079  ORF Transcript_10058/g.27079 Transcript_10058/m.27079 type:complete len:424 (-) Transcript_10058:7-1278(-)